MNYPGSTIRMTQEQIDRRRAKDRKPRKPIKRRSLRKGVTRTEYARFREAVFERAGGMCEFRGCRRAATDVHHGAGRTGKLITDVRCAIAVCRECHALAHRLGLQSLLAANIGQDRIADIVTARHRGWKEDYAAFRDAEQGA